MTSTPDASLGDALIPVINNLQDIFNQVSINLDLELPQIAVVGSQSSGKSSVLESLVGRDFLPRGPNICTRRPLVLQLVKGSADRTSRGDGKEWGEFQHKPGRKFYDFDEIRREIEDETDRVTGTNKGLSEKPIRLRIHSPTVLTMTMVDLPGVARVPVGDQPSDIEQQIRAMIHSYIRHPSCIILAVSAANVDIANSDALSVAQSVDPRGLRTVGVLTKIDIMDRGTSAAPILRNQVVPLRLGYMAVVNRSQDDINTSVSMHSARLAEERFFTTHRELEDVRGQCGVPALARRLNSILCEHIRDVLPDLCEKVNIEAAKRAEELESYGEPPVADDKVARGTLLLQIITDYCERYGAMLEGRYEDVPVDQLSGGARIRYIFKDVFCRNLDAIKPGEQLTNDQIHNVICNSSGVQGSMFLPFGPFEMLVKKQVSRMSAPVMDCKEMVLEELMRIAGLCAPQRIMRFPAFQRHLADAVREFIEQGAEPAEKMAMALVDIEHGWINMDHPAFIGSRGAIRKIMDRNRQLRQRQAGADAGAHPGRSASNGSIAGTRPESLSDNAAGGLKGLGRTHASSAAEIASASGSSRSGKDSEKDADSDAAVSWLSMLGILPRPDSVASKGSGELQLPLSRPSTGAAQQPALAGSQPSLSESDQIQADAMKEMVRSYCEIVKGNLMDSVPKSLMHFLVNRTRNGLQQHLISNLYKEDLFDTMLSEREDIVQRRKLAQEALRALQAARLQLQLLPDQLRREAHPSDSLVTIDNPAEFAAYTASRGLRSRAHNRNDRLPSMSQAAHAAEEASALLSGQQEREVAFGFGDRLPGDNNA